VFSARAKIQIANHPVMVITATPLAAATWPFKCARIRTCHPTTARLVNRPVKHGAAPVAIAPNGDVYGPRRHPTNDKLPP